MLAEAMLELGTRAGRDVVCLLTDMDQPLGHAVGQRARDPRGDRARSAAKGRPTSRSSSSTACARLLALSDLGVDEAEGATARRGSDRRRDRRRRVRALDPRPGRRPDVGRAAATRAVSRARSTRRGTGVVTRLGAIAVGIGRASTLGAGGATKDDTIDHAVGVRLPRASGATGRRGRGCSPRCTRATRRRAAEAVDADAGARTSSATRQPPSRADRARRR